jgi:HSP20 family protein
MLITRVNDSHPIRLLRGEFDRLFSNFMETFPVPDPFGVRGRRPFPAVNAWEDDKTVYAEAELPGLAMEDIEVLVMGDELTLKGERKDLEREGATYHRRERGVGAFSRVLRLPVQIDADKVQATLRDGVLTVKLPKAQTALPRKIELTS